MKPRQFIIKKYGEEAASLFRNIHTRIMEHYARERCSEEKENILALFVNFLIDTDRVRMKDFNSILEEFNNYQDEVHNN